MSDYYTSKALQHTYLAISICTRGTKFLYFIDNINYKNVMPLITTMFINFFLQMINTVPAKHFKIMKLSQQSEISSCQ